MSGIAEYTFTAVGEHLRLSPSTVANSMRNNFCVINPAHFIEIGGVSNLRNIQISVIYNFCKTICAAIENHRPRPIIICPEDDAVESTAIACQLCGAYLLLCECQTVESLFTTFEDTLDEISSKTADDISTRRNRATQLTRVNIMDSWKALDRAQDLRWLGMNHTEGDHDIEMASHYALTYNGGVRILVPGKLVFFPAPKALPAHRTWADVVVPGQPTMRRFSATFFAALLPELDVSVVACMGRTSGSAAAAFRAGGLDVHDLALDARRPALLGAMDRLLSISRAAPGATALFPGGGAGGGEAVQEWVGTLATAVLISDFGFSSETAAAWLRMV